MKQKGRRKTGRIQPAVRFTPVTFDADPRDPYGKLHPPPYTGRTQQIVKSGQATFLSYSLENGSRFQNEVKSCFPSFESFSRELRWEGGYYEWDEGCFPSEKGGCQAYWRLQYNEPTSTCKVPEVLKRSSGKCLFYVYKYFCWYFRFTQFPITCTLNYARSDVKNHLRRPVVAMFPLDLLEAKEMASASTSGKKNQAWRRCV